MTQEKAKYLFTVTHYGDNADRVAAPLVLANSALASGADVLLWFSVDGTEFAKKGAADGIIPPSFPPLADLLSAFEENGGRIGVCPPCGKTHGVTEENMVDNGEWMGAVAVLEAAQERQAFSF